MNDVKNEVAKFTNQDRKDGSLKDVIVDADVFIGVSVAGALTKEMVQSMAKDPIILQWQIQIRKSCRKMRVKPEQALSELAVLTSRTK